MKDIKELIYAAVEEDAVAFQELAGNILQARAYDAIEAMRPEVGASMFGEAKEMEDDEEDEEDEDEDEDEDEVKESVREYLNQQGTGKSAEGYDDAGTFDRQTAEKHAAKHGGKVVPDPSGKHLVKLPGKKKMQEALHPNQQKIDVVDDEKIDAKDFAKLRAMKKMKEEVEQIDELNKQTLVNYINKASERAAGHAFARSGEKDDHHRAKGNKKVEGIHRALGKLAKEDVEQVEEDFSNEKRVRNRVARANDDHEYSQGVADEKRKEGLYDPIAINRLKKTDKAADAAHSGIKKTAVANFIKKFFINLFNFFFRLM